MRKLYLSKIAAPLIFLGIILFSNVVILACSCSIKLACEEFSEAEAVFIGKLERIGENTGYTRNGTSGYFLVEKTFKGKTERIEQVALPNGGCSDLKLTVSEKYFVYKHAANKDYLCSRTNLLSLSSDDLKYAESLSETNPIFTISGRLNSYEPSGFSSEAVKNSEVWIEQGNNKINLKLDKDGNFEYVAKEKGAYRVKIVLPVETEVSMSSWSGKIRFMEGNGFKLTRTKDQTMIEYELDFEPNSCSFREISKTPQL